jgi:PEP-CTERM motif
MLTWLKNCLTSVVTKERENMFSRHPNATLGALAVAALASAAVPAHAVTYTFQNIIDPVNPTFTQALGINDSGTIVGYGNMTIFNGFQLVLPPVAGNFTRLNVPNQTGGTQVFGITANGLTTDGFSVSAAGVNSGFVHTGTTFTPILQDAFTQLLGVNPSGTIAAGYSSIDPAGVVGQTAITVSGGPSFTTPVFTNINALLPANFNSQATGVNDSGEVVGFYQNAMGDFVAFTDIGGTITPFQFPGSMSTQALGVNDLGDIVGDYLDAAGVMHGFVDDLGSFTTLDPTGSTATTINGINDLGTVVGFYVNAAGATIGTLGTVATTTVPEPTSLLLLASGLFGVGVFVRRRRAG